ncbi:endonuclease/exonuclease/phosphatase family protein [Curtobacterium flaccumfaciens pv. flaccumfaciens]|uniref:endonuclease/exonuclease/phosphatase family protein n=1 Tax=Curtobacterium flaccumfaciens TaxID=2035 RepID=UPI001BDE622C|nr:endonuclease/exonuclease/phosphatase family protein [Curtobacterium flaccumfaciens]MBT1669129.1 endonuclease/exonuclease/phosphatase family protein [Curtobacterium flaccumfaciens pv. flaccumfaciens]
MSRRRAATPTTAVVVAAAVLVLGGVTVVAPWIGIERVAVVAAVLPARALVTVVFLGIGAGLVLVAVVLRRVRVVASAVGVVLLVLAAANGAVIAARGWDVRPVSDAPGGLRVFEWNTNGGLVSGQGAADAALSVRADVVVLPDAGDRASAVTVVQTMARHGRAMRLFMGGEGAEVAVLIRADLAPGASMRPGVDPVKTLSVSVPGMPTIIAVHAPHPVLHGLAGWRADLRWVGATCGRGADVIVSGDFNASVDDFGGAGLGSCRDAASTVRAAGLGTWPTWLDPRLAMPIDHTLVGPAAGGVRSFTVLRAEDRSGARHRPTLTVVAVRG